jgi:hypothetical protein
VVVEGVGFVDAKLVPVTVMYSSATLSVGPLPTPTAGYDTAGASNEKNVSDVPMTEESVIPARLAKPAPYVPQFTVVLELHVVVPHAITSFVMVAVGVRSYFCPKLRPLMVTLVCADVTVFLGATADVTGPSKEKASLLVPTLAETVRMEE